MRDASPPRPTRRRGLATLAGIIIAAGGLWIVSRQVSWAELRAAVATANPALIIAALFFVVFASWLRALRWRSFFHPSEAAFTVSGLWRIILIGQFVNIVLPVRAGEATRPVLVGQRFKRDWWETAGTVALEKAFDGIAFAILMLVASMVVPLPAAIERLRLAIILPAAVAIAGLMVMALSGPSLQRRLEEHAADGRWFRRVARGMAAVMKTFVSLRRPALVLRLLVQSLSVWIVASIPNYLVLAALGIPVAPASGVAVLIALQLGTAIASTPGNVGLFEVICVATLAAFGVDGAPALAFGLLLHVTAYVFPLIAGGLLTAEAVRDGVDVWRGGAAEWPASGGRN